MSFCGSRRAFAVGTAAIALGLTLASVAAAQGGTGALHNARRFGGSTAFYRLPVETVDALQRMMAQPGIVADIRHVLDQAGLSSAADAVVATLTEARTVMRGTTCAGATPADGTLVECDFEPGGTLLWMAYRPTGQGGRPGLIEGGIRWAGERSFRAFLFRVTEGDRIYTFVLPTVCSNLSLVSVHEVPELPAQISVERTCAPDGTLRAVVTAAGDLSRVARVRVAIDGRPAGELTPSSWSMTTYTPGTYSFDASDAAGHSYPVTRASIVVEACPPPPPPPPITVVTPTCDVSLSAGRVKGGYQITVDATRSTTGTSEVAPVVSVELRDPSGAVVGQTLTLDSRRSGTVMVRQPGTYRATATVSTPRVVQSGNNRYEGTDTCEASVTIAPPPLAPLFFIEALGGKERRVRPIGDPAVDVAHCSPLVGLKVGVAKPFDNGWELAGAVGVAISVDTGNDDVEDVLIVDLEQSAIFIDAEVNKYLGRSFIGTGLSLWDVTYSERFTPAWLLHFGVPVTTDGARFPVFVVAESRLFLDHADDVTNNYLIWGGLRFQFGKR